MALVKKNSWSTADLDLLRDYAAKGYSVYRTAGALRRSAAAVRSMAQRIKVSVPSGKTIRAKISAASR